MNFILNFIINRRIKAFQQLLDKKILVTTEEAAGILGGVRESHVRGLAYLKRDPLPMIRIGKSMLYKRSDLIKFKTNSANFERLRKKIDKKAKDIKKRIQDEEKKLEQDQKGPGEGIETPQSESDKTGLTGQHGDDERPY